MRESVFPIRQAEVAPSSWVDPEFTQRINNWVRWCKRGRQSAASLGCVSLESHYRQSNDDTHVSGWGDWKEARPVTRSRQSTNVLDALVVDRAFCRLPEFFRRCIKIYYFKPHLRLEWMARKLKVHPLAVESRVRSAVRALKCLVVEIEHGRLSA